MTTKNKRDHQVPSDNDTISVMVQLCTIIHHKIIKLSARSNKVKQVIS